MPDRVTSLDELTRNVLARPQQLLVVDGMPLSGKSTLAKNLAHAIRCTAIGCDDYLEHDQGSFLEALRYDTLRRDLDRACSTSGKVILEGVCIREVMRRLALDPRAAVMIYVKRMSLTGDWADADDLAPMTPSMRAAVAALGGEEYRTPILRLEVRGYHENEGPDAAA